MFLKLSLSRNCALQSRGCFMHAATSGFIIYDVNNDHDITEHLEELCYHCCSSFYSHLDLVSNFRVNIRRRQSADIWVISVHNPPQSLRLIFVLLKDAGCV